MQIECYKGWFGICPIYLDTIDTDCPMIVARHVVFEPLLFLSEMFFSGLIFLCSMVDEDYEPLYPMKITGKTMIDEKVFEDDCD